MQYDTINTSGKSAGYKPRSNERGQHRPTRATWCFTAPPGLPALAIMFADTASAPAYCNGMHCVKESPRSAVATRPSRMGGARALVLLAWLALSLPGRLMAIPAITTQPQSQTVGAGSTAAFNVTAVGNVPLSYQWRLNGVNLPGQTTPALTLPNVQASQSGGYSVVVTDSAGAGGGSSLLTGLISYWKLDEAGGTRIDSHGANPLTEVGPVGQIAGKLGNAARYTGSTLSGSVLSHAHNTDLALGGDTPFTFSCWFWMDSKEDYKGMILKRVTTAAETTEYQLYYSIAFDRLRFGISDGVNIGHAEAMTFSSPPVSTWVHCVFWHDAVANTINIQVNGGPVESAPWPFGTQTTSGPFTLGQAIPGFYYLNGRLDGVGFWKRTLTTAERTSLYNAGVGMEYPFSSAPPAASGSVTSLVANLTVTGGAPVITAQPQGVPVLLGQNATFNVSAVGAATLRYQWRFNGTNIAGATASSFTVSNAQPVNVGNYSVRITNGLGTATSSNALLAVGSNTGAAAALLFDGTNDFVNVPDSPSVRITNTLTVEAWIRRAAMGTQHCIVEKYDCAGAAATVGGYALRVQADDRLAFFTLNDCNGGGSVVGATLLQSNTWYHVAGVWDGAQIRVLVNGVVDGFAATTNAPKAGNTPLKIGERGNGGSGFNGIIDEVRLWNVARTDTQILNNRGIRLAGNLPGLAGYWRFDEAMGSVAGDSTTNGNHGTLVNGPAWVLSTAPVIGLLNVATTPAGAITTSSATLNGTVTPGGTPTSAFFQYGATTGYGGTTALQNMGSGSSALPLSAGITGLVAGVTYHYRVVAFNAASGTNFGADGVFTTLSMPPAIVTQPASAVTGTAATLNGTANPNGSATTAYYQWGTTTNFGNLTAPQVVGSGTSAVSVPGVTTGLAPGTAYFYRLVAFNAIGTNMGGTLNFTTPLPPVATTLPATTVTGTGAMLNGLGNPSGSAATAFFQWGLTTNLGSATASQNIGAGVIDVPVSTPLSGLLPATTYFYRAVVASAGGTNVDGLASFTTLPLPLAITLSASDITGTGATLNGSVNPNGLDTSAFFQWGLTTAYGNTTPAQPLGSDSNAVPVAQAISGLIPGSTYHFRMVGVSAAGTNFDGNATFRVPVLPTVATLAATNVTSGGASLNATASAGGGDTMVYFQYGTTTNYDGATDPMSIGSGTNTVPLTLPIGGLANGATYHFRAVASNVVGTVFGTNRAFFTIPAGAGMAIQFDGTNDFVNVPFAPGLDLTGPFTVEAWVFRAVTGAQHSVVEKYACGGIGGYVLRIRADDKLFFGVRDDCTTGASVAGATSVTPNVWHHVAGVWDGSQLRVYLDGVLDGTLASTRAPRPGNTPMRIGARGNDAGTTFNGVIDEVRLWNFARTQSQLQTNMGRVLVGSESGLAGYWRFDDGIGLAALDSSGNGNTGALTNGPVWVPSSAPLIGLLSITTSPATGITGFSANLNGTVGTSGNATTAFFQWGTNNQFGNTTPVFNFGAGSNNVVVAQPLTGLLPGTTYFFRLVGNNISAGTNAGATLSFSTPAAPTAAFVAAPTAGLVPLNVRFTNLTTGVTTSLSWDFGDGTTSALANPIKIYSSAGLYTVSLTATGPGGTNTAMITDYITVTNPPPPPVAAFSGSPTIGAAPLLVNFLNLTTGAAGSYAWDFGDGTTSSAVNPAKTYGAVGIYTVRLISTGLGGSDTNVQTSYITVTNPPPVAGFIAGPTNGFAPLTVNFTNLTAGAVTDYAWDFGDGTVDIAANPVKTYTNAGDYTVTLTATGPGGIGTLTRTNYITVANLPPAPVSAFSATPLIGAAPLLVNFTNLTTGSATNYSWDFGDGGISAAINPAWSYATAGVFTVRLIASGLGGSTTNAQINMITVTNPPPAGPGMAVQFDGINDFINVPDSPSVRITGTITIEAWIRRTATGVQHSIVEKYGCAGLGGYVFRVTASDKLMFGTRDDCNLGTSALGGTTLLANTWYHVAGLWDGAQIRLYVNGVLDGMTFTTRNPKAGTTPLRIGARGNEAGTPFAGVIDEVRLWNTVRTVASLQTNMNRRLVGTEAGLAGYWRLDEGTGLLASDSSPNGNTGALTNGPIWVVSTAPISGTGGSGGGGALAMGFDEPSEQAPTLLKVSADKENNALLVTLTATPSSHQAIEVSSDLVNWKWLGAIRVNADGTFEFRDEIIPAADTRFYRLRETGPPIDVGAAME